MFLWIARNERLLLLVLGLLSNVYAQELTSFCSNIRRNNYESICDKFTKYLSNAVLRDYQFDYNSLNRFDNTTRLDAFTSTVLMAIFVEVPTPFLKEQLKKLRALDYPKDKIHVLIYNNVPYHTARIESFAKKINRTFGSVYQVNSTIPQDEVIGISFEYFRQKECDYYFHVTSIAHLDNPYTLKILMGENRTITAPILASPKNARSSLLKIEDLDSGFGNNLEIVQRKRDCFLINSRFLKEFNLGVYDQRGNPVWLDRITADMQFIEAHHFDFNNATYFGHLVDAYKFFLGRPSPEMYELFTNPVDWEAKYISPLYLCNFARENVPQMPCPSVFWFPLAKRVFCRDLIRMMETYKCYKHIDRFQMLDVQLTNMYWIYQYRYFVRKYVGPLGKRVFKNFFCKPSSCLIHYGVKYTLYKHYAAAGIHIDNSQYTATIELSDQGVDYDGGGCRFIWTNCTVCSKPGWIVIFPGRFGHEGVRITRGLRYILVTLIDPAMWPLET